MDEHLQTLEHAQKTAIDLAIQFGPKLAVALLIVAVGFYAGRLLGKLMHSMLNKLGLETFRERGISIPFPQREVRLLGQP